MIKKYINTSINMALCPEKCPKFICEGVWEEPQLLTNLTEILKNEVALCDYWSSQYLLYSHFEYKTQENYLEKCLALYRCSSIAINHQGNTNKPQ